MSNFELNKIFAAFLVAGITAMLGGFIAEHLVRSDTPETDAVAIEGAVTDAGAVASASPAVEPILHLIAAADVTKGEKISKACAACHSFDKGGPDKVGPDLWDVLGGPKGQKPGFSYSEAMASQEGMWSYADLNHFLWKPKAFVPGTKMNFIGLKKPEDRAAIIAWLRTLSDAPAGLPSEAEIAAEAPTPEESAELPAPAGEETPAEVSSEAPAPLGPVESAPSTGPAL